MRLRNILCKKTKLIINNNTFLLKILGNFAFLHSWACLCKGKNENQNLSVIQSENANEVKFLTGLWDFPREISTASGRLPMPFGGWGLSVEWKAGSASRLCLPWDCGPAGHWIPVKDFGELWEHYHPGTGVMQDAPRKWSSFSGAAHIVPLYPASEWGPCTENEAGGGSLWRRRARSVLPASGMVIPLLRTLQGNLEGKLSYTSPPLPDNLKSVCVCVCVCVCVERAHTRKPSTSWQLKKCVCVCVCVARAHTISHSSVLKRFSLPCFALYLDPIWKVKQLKCFHLGGHHLKKMNSDL